MEINQNDYNSDVNELVSDEKANSKSHFLLAMFLTSFVSVLIGVIGVLVLLHYFPNFISSTKNITRTEKEVTVTDNGIADAVEKVYDSVVIIKNHSKDQLYATGTGFIYKRIGNKYYILTNYHVIEGGTSVGVQFTNGEEAKVVVEEGDKYADVAVLSYETRKSYAVSEIGSSVEMRVGDTVFAIGAPLDSSVYSWSVTRGVLSGKDREVEVKVGNVETNDWIMQVLQTDAAINNGNSGGPLCNSNGQVIGITNMKLASSTIEGMGFAIPIEEAVAYADAVINNEDVSRPFIGISMTNASRYVGEDQEGVYIEEVQLNSPADKAGLKAGDIITYMDDDKVKDVAALRYKLYKYKVGDTITIEYIRDGNPRTTKLSLAKN